MDNGEVSWGRSVAVGVSERWKVTCDMWYVTCDMWHLTCDSDMWHMIFSSSIELIKCKKVQEQSQKVTVIKKRAKMGPKVQKGVKKAGFHSIGATIHTPWELVSTVCRTFFYGYVSIYIFFFKSSTNCFISFFFFLITVTTATTVTTVTTVTYFTIWYYWTLVKVTFSQTPRTDGPTDIRLDF